MSQHDQAASEEDREHHGHTGDDTDKTEHSPQHVAYRNCLGRRLGGYLDDDRGQRLLLKHAAILLQALALPCSVAGQLEREFREHPHPHAARTLGVTWRGVFIPRRPRDIEMGPR